MKFRNLIKKAGKGIGSRAGKARNAAGSAASAVGDSAGNVASAVGGSVVSTASAAGGLAAKAGGATVSTVRGGASAAVSTAVESTAGAREAIGDAKDALVSTFIPGEIRVEVIHPTSDPKDYTVRIVPESIDPGEMDRFRPRVVAVVESGYTIPDEKVLKADIKDALVEYMKSVSTSVEKQSPGRHKHRDKLLMTLAKLAPIVLVILFLKFSGFENLYIFLLSVLIIPYLYLIRKDLRGILLQITNAYREALTNKVKDSAVAVYNLVGSLVKIDLSTVTITKIKYES